MAWRTTGQIVDARSEQAGNLRHCSCKHPNNGALAASPRTTSGTPEYRGAERGGGHGSGRHAPRATLESSPSASHCAGRAAQAAPQDLHAHSCIRQHLPSGKRYRWEFSKHGEEVAIDVPGALTLDDNDLLVEAAAGGLGIAYVPERFARKRLEAGNLVAVLEDWCPPNPGLVLYYPRNRHVPSALRALVDTLKATYRN